MRHKWALRGNECQPTWGIGCVTPAFLKCANEPGVYLSGNDVWMGWYMADDVQAGGSMAADEELFREWQEGSAGALEALVQRHHAALLAHLTRLTGSSQLAEDVAQETFLRLVRDGQSYRYPRPFLSWFYTIARHLALNALQSAYARRVEYSPELLKSVAVAPDSSEWLERWERREGLRAALAELTFEQREVLSLRFGQELSVQETAAVLAVPDGTVKSRTFTALRRLRDALKQREEVDERREFEHG